MNFVKVTLIDAEMAVVNMQYVQCVIPGNPIKGKPTSHIRMLPHGMSGGYSGSYINEVHVFGTPEDFLNSLAKSSSSKDFSYEQTMRDMGH